MTKINIDNFHRVASFLPRLDHLEYFPLSSTASQYFKDSDFDIYKVGQDIFTRTDLFPLVSILNQDPKLLIETRNPKLTELFVFFIRNNCQVNCLQTHILYEVKKMILMPIKVRSDVTISIRTDMCGIETSIKPEIGSIYEFDEPSFLKITWNNQQGGYEKHSFFAVSWK